MRSVNRLPLHFALALNDFGYDSVFNYSIEAVPIGFTSHALRLNACLNIAALNLPAKIFHQLNFLIT